MSTIGIAKVYDDLYEATKTKSNLKEGRINEAIRSFMEAAKTNRESLLKEVAHNPALKKTWQEYKNLAHNLSEKEFQTTLQKMFDEILEIKTIPKLNPAAACKKHGVTLFEYENFMRPYNGKIEGIPGKTLPLIKAVVEEKSGIVNVLKELEANIDQMGSDGMTPLIAAVTIGSLDMVKLLGELGANVDQPGRDGNFPLIIAVINGNLEMVDALHELNPNMDQQASDGQTAMSLAISTNQLDMVELLYRCGADKDQPDGEGKTPMAIAVKVNNWDIITFLDKCGADIHQGDKQGMTPMAIAALRNDVGMMKFLYKLEPSINLNQSVNLDPSKNDPKPLLNVVMLANMPEAAKLLKDLGADETYASKYIGRKFVAQLFGIAGNSTLTDEKGKNPITFKLEGLSTSYAMQKLSNYVKDFLAKENHVELQEKDKIVIQEAIENAFPLSTESDAQMLMKIQSGKPVVILGGCKGHAISMVITNNELIICNRGLGKTSNGIEFYSFPEGGITKDMIKDLKFEHPDIQSFNHMVQKYHLLKEKGIFQKEQKVGNCSWASAKGIFRILCHLYTDKETERKLYKEFTEDSRERGLREYLALEGPCDENAALLEQIKIKSNKRQAKAKA